ncbi:MAG TPA: ATPase P [Chloroflexota bacterium]
MIELEIPGWRRLRLEHLLLDVNGTIARDGELLAGVADRVAALRQLLAVRVLSADTFGRLDEQARALRIPALRLRAGEPEGGQKAAVVRGLGPAGVVAIGNGANDAEMLAAAAVGIAVLGPEGLASRALASADVVVSSIEDGLDLLLRPRRLVATLRR